jgi:hypothetical protein
MSVIYFKKSLGDEWAMHLVQNEVKVHIFIYTQKMN